MGNVKNNTEHNAQSNVRYNNGTCAYIDVEPEPRLLFGSEIHSGLSEVVNIGTEGNGTINGAVYGLDSFGSHLFFDGSSIVSVPSMTGFASGFNRAYIEAWINIPYVRSATKMICGTSGVRYTSISTRNGYLSFDVTAGSQKITTATTINTGLTHVMGCYTGASFDLYINGLLSASTVGSDLNIYCPEVFNMGGGFDNPVSPAAFRGKIYTTKASIIVPDNPAQYAKHEYQRGMHFINAV